MALTKGLIVCFGVALPITAWGADCCGGHSSGHGSHQAAAANREHGDHTVKNEAESSGDSATDAALQSYFDIRASLAQDTLKEVPAHANAFAKEIEDLSAGDSADTAKDDAEGSLEADMAATARELAGKKDIESARTDFGKLSSQLYDYRKMSGAASDDVHVFACDMAKKIWLQEGDIPGNPYYGLSMAKCGRKIE